jgi:tetratricopeptide (TPR) repeat protein
VLAFVKRSVPGDVDPDAGARVAAQFAATHFVLGTIVETGGGMDLRASLYLAGGELRGSATASVGDGGDLVPVVDSLTRQLIATRYPSGVQRLTRLAVATSTSLPALKAYLEGEGLVRAGNHSAAVDAFSRATQADSTFALAWYRLAVALESTLQPRAAADAVESAVRHADRLPERDRLLLEGWQAYAAGRADEAEAMYRRILDRYPDELEAWLQVGEIGFHHAASRGEGIGVARPAFERVLALDPDHEAAHVHLARIAGQARDVATLRVHTEYLIAKRPGSGVALEMAALEAFAAGDQAAVAALRPRFEAEDSYTVLATLMNSFHAGDMEGMEWCADLLRAPTRPVEVRTAGHIVRALLDLARGDRAAALVAAARAESLDAFRGLEARALLLTAPFADVDTAETRSVRGTLGQQLSARVPESFFLPDPDGIRPLMRRYLLGLLDAQLGDTAAALRLAVELERAPHSGADETLPADLAAAVRAEVARLRGDAAAALALLERIRERPTYQLVLPSPFEARARERFVKARLLEKLGRFAEARALYNLIGARSLYDLPYRTPSEAGRGRQPLGQARR